jgi:hypothetical protein
MNRSSQPPGRSAPKATAGLPSCMPVACSFGHRLSAADGLRLDWLAMSGSLKPSRMCPCRWASARLALVTLPAPQIIGTNRTPAGALIPFGPAAQV